MVLVLLSPTDISLQVTPSHSVSSYVDSEWLSMDSVTQFWAVNHERKGRGGIGETSGQDFLTLNKKDKTGTLLFVSSGH